MLHVFVCRHMQLYTVLCCSYIYSILLKIKHKLYIVAGSAPSPPNEKFWVRSFYNLILLDIMSVY